MDITIPNSLLFNKVTLVSKKKICTLKNISSYDINYKNINLLKNYISEQGRIVSSRFSHVSLKKQKILNRAIKVARHIALLPYVKSF